MNKVFFSKYVIGDTISVNILQLQISHSMFACSINWDEFRAVFSLSVRILSLKPHSRGQQTKALKYFRLTVKENIHSKIILSAPH